MAGMRPYSVPKEVKTLSFTKRSGNRHTNLELYFFFAIVQHDYPCRGVTTVLSQTNRRNTLEKLMVHAFNDEFEFHLTDATVPPEALVFDRFDF